MKVALSRRRFIAISAAAGACALPTAAWSSTVPPQRWRGIALGAQASLLLHHPDRDEANRLIAASVAEITRLENIFSLYRANSALSKLNRDSRLDHPPLDLVQALAECRSISAATRGAFDVTVQPLWRLYAEHFADQGAASAGPSSQDIAAARALVNYRDISISERRIALARDGMGITLNGFAQGFITDRIAEFLRRAGMKNVLVDIGETRALDEHPDGRSWRLGIRSPSNPNDVVRTIAFTDQAIATSGGYGTKFDSAGRHHHLFDPQTGRSTVRYASVTVIASKAATADALSTAFSNMPVNKARRCLHSFGASAAYFRHHDGKFEDVV